MKNLVELTNEELHTIEGGNAGVWRGLIWWLANMTEDEKEEFKEGWAAGASRAGRNFY